MNESCDNSCLVDCAGCEESQPLLSQSSMPSGSSSHNRRSHLNRELLKDICLPSKAAVLLICLAAVVGAVYIIFVASSLLVLVDILFLGSHYINESLMIVIVYLSIIITIALYPVSGFLADVFCGHYRVMMISMCLLIVSFVLMLGAATPLLVDPNLYPFSWSGAKMKLFILLVALFAVTLGIGLIIYYANIIQFGLDQLMEAPSEYLGLCIHWIVWADRLPSAVIIPLLATLPCINHYPLKQLIVGSVPLVCFVLLIFLLVFSCWKRHWFYTERGQHNPYKMVIKVLNFARKHKYPLQRSAFTYCDDERPSRLDFCKERFGGPFTTEQVEDVKTLLRILLVLLAIGPVFVLDVPNRLFTFPLIGIHISHKGHQYCDASWIVFESGSLRYITSAVFFPAYICITFSKKTFRIFTRLGIGMFLCLASVLSLLIVDVIGHTQSEVTVNESSQCVFDITYDTQTMYYHIPRLGMHWASLITTECLLGIGQLIFVTASLEFISAQSPHSMKGLLFGLYYTVQYFFNLLGSLLLLPFSLDVIWNSKQMKEHPPVTNCGFGYFSSICVVAVIGLVLFSVVAKNYKYRERGDRPYDQQAIEEIYSREIAQRHERDKLRTN